MPDKTGSGQKNHWEFRLVNEVGFLKRFDEWVDVFAKFVEEKGKVQPGKFRAFGYSPKSHKWADLKLMWRDRMMRVGHAPADSSPQKQHEMNINRDATMSPKQGEGPKLRDS